MDNLRVLGWMDSPLSVTGFGIVAKNLLGRLNKLDGFDVATVGINHFDEHANQLYDGRDEVPYKVLIGHDYRQARGPNGGLAMDFKDPFGRAKTIDLVKQGACDILFLMRDLWDMNFQQFPGEPHLSAYFPLHLQLAKEMGRNFRTVAHFPLESTLQDSWKPILEHIDYGYCFTAGGMEAIKPWEKNIKWCPQGADTNVFRKIENFDRAAFRREVMRVPEDSFIILNVNRNQPRKDIKSTIEAFALFKQANPQATNAVLWMHMRPDDEFIGVDGVKDARDFVHKSGLTPDKDVVFPPYFNVGTGWPEEQLNALYNACDLFVSTSLAEGFGLTNVEAGCAGLATLVPGHTGFLQTAHHLGMPYVATDTPRPVEGVGAGPVTPTNKSDLAERIARHYKTPSELNNLVKQNLSSFRKIFSWDNIFSEYWEPLFNTVAEELATTGDRQKVNKDRVFFVCDEAAGDQIAASKAIAGIKQTYPDKSIDFMCKPQYRNIQEGNPNIEKFVDWDINKLFDYDTNYVYYPHKIIRHSGWGLGPYHLMDLQAQLIGVPLGEPYINVEPFDLLLDDMDGETNPIITIQTTSQGGKMLAPEKWSTIIQTISQQHPDVRFAVVGGPSDLLLPGCIDFRGLTFSKQAWLQKHAICHLGIDSSAAHMASVVGTPQIVVWGWTNPETCKPQRHSINIIPFYPGVCPLSHPCHGVHQPGQPWCGINQYDINSAMSAPCIQSISPNLVIDPLLRGLNASGEERDYGKAKEFLKELALRNNGQYIYGLKHEALDQEAPVVTQKEVANV